MKTLKITFALAAVLMLTVSGVKSEDVAQNNEQTYKQKPTHINLVAHNKAKMKLPDNG